MFKNLFGIRNDHASSPESLQPQERMRAIEGSDMAELAARLLIAPTALMRLTPDEALTVVSYMIPHKIPADTTFITEGDHTDTGYMALLLEGEVTVENMVINHKDPVTVTVLGPGGLIGEMRLVDDRARLASCTATTDVLCAILSRAALEKLGTDDPRTATKLMLAVALRIAERLRETTEKLKRYSQLVQAMQQEIDQRDQRDQRLAT